MIIIVIFFDGYLHTICEDGVYRISCSKMIYVTVKSQANFNQILS